MGKWYTIKRISEASSLALINGKFHRVYCSVVEHLQGIHLVLGSVPSKTHTRPNKQLGLSLYIAQADFKNVMMILSSHVLDVALSHHTGHCSQLLNITGDDMLNKSGTFL